MTDQSKNEPKSSGFFSSLFRRKAAPAPVEPVSAQESTVEAPIAAPEVSPPAEEPVEESVIAPATEAAPKQSEPQSELEPLSEVVAPEEEVLAIETIEIPQAAFIETEEAPVATVASLAVEEPVAQSVEPITKAVTVVPEIMPKEEAQEEKKGFFGRLRDGLSRTRKGLVGGLADLFQGKKIIDRDLLDELETRLLMADVGVDVTDKIIQRLTEQLSRKELTDFDTLLAELRKQMLEVLAPCAKAFHVDASKKPFTILMVGVNGVGKTTTIGKIAKRLKNEGRSVMLAAGDTFRAAAVEQLQVWGERNQIPVVAQATGADAASVTFDAMHSATAKKTDVLLADTAGRLHTQDGLMQELAKIVRVMGKQDATAPHETLIVLDAGNGQNALVQATQFHACVKLSGIILTKLDGTAKGGILLAIAQKLQVPIYFIGVGEGIEDLRPFNPEEFVDALLGMEKA